MADAKTETAKADDKPKTLKVTVAKGRTISHGGAHVTNTKGDVTGSSPGREYGPGDQLEMDEGEARDLIAAGFLNNPDADAPVILTGPKIQRTED